MSSNAAGDASATQAKSADKSLQLQADIYNQNRSDLTPWRLAGQNALAQLEYSLGIGPAPGAPATDSAPSSNGLVTLGGGGGNGGTSGGGFNLQKTITSPAFSNPGGFTANLLGIHDPINDFVSGTIGDVFGGSGNQRGPMGQVRHHLKVGKPISDQMWQAAGFPAGGGQPGADLAKKLGVTPPTSTGNANLEQMPVGNAVGSPNAAGPPGTGAGATAAPGPYGAFQESPGYKFAYDEGLRALQSNFARAGMTKSGAYDKALTRFGQGTANQEFGNWLNRLSSLAGQGQTATTNGVTAGQNFATNAGQTMQDAAAARASGYVGSANAWSTTANGLSKLAGNYFGTTSGGGTPSSGSTPASDYWTWA